MRIDLEGPAEVVEEVIGGATREDREGVEAAGRQRVVGARRDRSEMGGEGRSMSVGLTVCGSLDGHLR
jgi:hypothetical protein